LNGEAPTSRSSAPWRHRRRALRWARQPSGGLEWNCGQRSGGRRRAGLRPPGRASHRSKHAPRLDYLSAYVSRTALSNQRILRDEHGKITFKYKASGERSWRTLTVTASEFLRRFLQHVLPKSFQRVRYYGWLGPAAKVRWQRILALLDWQPPARVVTRQPQPFCPRCGRPLCWLGTLERAPP